MSTPTPGEIAAQTYIQVLDPAFLGWSATFGEVRTDEQGHYVVPTTFRRGSEKWEYEAHVWAPSRVGEMEPETAGTITAAVTEERLAKWSVEVSGGQWKPAKPTTSGEPDNAG